MSPYVAEFLGTMLLTLLGNGVVGGVLLKDSKAENDGWLTIVLGWGLAVTLAVYAVGRISGAHINPAVTLAFWVYGDFPGDLVAGYMLAQFAGAFAGATLVWIHYLGHWPRTESPALKLGIFCTGPAVRATIPNLISEVLATIVLVLGILFIGANKYYEGLNPILLGALIVAIGVSLGGTTGFAINPARDLGPRLAHFILPIPGKGSSDWSYSWIPVVGPLIGGVIGALLFKVLFV